MPAHLAIPLTSDFLSATDLRTVAGRAPLNWLSVKLGGKLRHKCPTIHTAQCAGIEPSIHIVWNYLDLNSAIFRGSLNCDKVEPNRSTFKPPVSACESISQLGQRR